MEWINPNDIIGKQLPKSYIASIDFGQIMDVTLLVMGANLGGFNINSDETITIHVPVRNEIRNEIHLWKN